MFSLRGSRRRDLFAVLFGGPPLPSPPPTALAPVVAPPPLPTPTIDISSLPAASPRTYYDNGEKYPGGLGPAYLLTIDYETLRIRSRHLFETNLEARAAIQRLITNEIATGLSLEATPSEIVLKRPDRSLTEWTDQVEALFEVWSSKANLCDHKLRLNWGQIQRAARWHALIEGDVLVVLRQHKRTGLPTIQLITADSITTPAEFWKGYDGREISRGVELDSEGRHVAYWVANDDGETRRIPAFDKSGRRMARLLYGNAEERVDRVRGKPLLSLVIQSLSDIGRYHDAALRKAVINSMLALFVTKKEPTPGSRPFSAVGGAVRLGTDAAVSTDGVQRSFRAAEQIPGLVLDELEAGEEPKAFPQAGVDTHIGEFTTSILTGVAIALEIPPEILLLSFNKAFSASQAAINEFGMYLDKARAAFASGFCDPVYEEWLISVALLGMINESRAILTAWRAANDIELSAWTLADWAGQVKPTADILKTANGIKVELDSCLITHQRASRKLGNGKFEHIIRTLKRENQQIADAMAPLRGLQQAQPSNTQSPADQEDEQEDKEDEQDLVDSA